jgi:hypothetical protein
MYNAHTHAAGKKATKSPPDYKAYYMPKSCDQFNN